MRQIFRSSNMFMNSPFLSLTKRCRQYLGFYSRLLGKTISVVALAAASSYLSYTYKICLDLHGNDIVSLAVVFPLAFAVNAAYQRRQDALAHLAALKGHALALRLCFAHWNRDQRQPKSLLGAADLLLETFFRDLKRYLVRRKLLIASEEGLVSTFTALSLLVDKLRANGLGPAELALANSYLRSMMVDFECMKIAHQYRMPSSLLLYLKFFLVVIPIIYGPVSANVAREAGSAVYAVFLAVLFAAVLTALDNTQDVLENPYDGLSADDIHFRHPTAILQSRLARSWSEAVPYLRLSPCDPHCHREKGRERAASEGTPAAAFAVTRSPAHQAASAQG